MEEAPQRSVNRTSSLPTIPTNVRRQRTAPTQITRNSLTSSGQESDVESAPRNRRYCGKLIRDGQGYRLTNNGQFNGMCSAQYGCQCWPCYILDYETKQRKNVIPNENQQSEPFAFINKHGNPCQISYCAFQSRTGSNYEKCKFYCSKPLRCTHNGISYTRHVKVFTGTDTGNGNGTNGNGTQQYSCECDGLCDASTLCQCQGCYELELIYQRQCDERLVIEIVQRKEILLSLSLLDSNEQFINNEHALCRVSFCPPSVLPGHYKAGYKFYCGRSIGGLAYYPLPSNCTCSGRCGPLKGCQCRGCFELDRQYRNALSTRNTSIQDPLGRILRIGQVEEEVPGMQWKHFKNYHVLHHHRHKHHQYVNFMIICIVNHYYPQWILSIQYQPVIRYH